MPFFIKFLGAVSTEHLYSPGEGEEIPACSWVCARRDVALMVKTNLQKNPNKTRACASSKEGQGCGQGYAENLTLGAQSQKGSGRSRLWPCRHSGCQAVCSVAV